MLASCDQIMSSGRFLAIHLFLVGFISDEIMPSIIAARERPKKPEEKFLHSIIPDVVCGRNEEYHECPMICNYDNCPTSEEKTQSCVRRKRCPDPACKCIFNYRRAENGTCIPTTECPPFACHQFNEEFNPCPPHCPSDDCSQASINETCPLLGFYMSVFCSPTCRCKKGYWRRYGRCIPYAECISTKLSENF